MVTLRELEDPSLDERVGFLKEAIKILPQVKEAIHQLGTSDRGILSDEGFDAICTRATSNVRPAFKQLNKRAYSHGRLIQLLGVIESNQDILKTSDTGRVNTRKQVVACLKHIRSVLQRDIGLCLAQVVIDRACFMVVHPQQTSTGTGPSQYISTPQDMASAILQKILDNIPDLDVGSSSYTQLVLEFNRCENIGTWAYMDGGLKHKFRFSTGLWTQRLMPTLGAFTKQLCVKWLRNSEMSTTLVDTADDTAYMSDCDE